MRIFSKALLTTAAVVALAACSSEAPPVATDEGSSDAMMDSAETAAPGTVVDVAVEMPSSNVVHVVPLSDEYSTT